MDTGRSSDRLPKNWRRVLSVRAAILLTTLVALLSVVTGILNIGQAGADFGPIADVVPPSVQQLVGFTGALTGFVMVVSAYALRKGLRVGWWATIVLLPVTAAQGVLQTNAISTPLVVLSALSIPTLLVTRRHFTDRVSLTTTQMAAAGALVGVQAYGTIGTWALREEFSGVANPLDAFYFTLITSSTVGYGDVGPTTPDAQLFTMSVVVLGVASFGIAIGALIGPAIQARLSKTLGKMTDTQIQTLENHVLVLGHGELTESILDELDAASVPYAVVTADREAAERVAADDRVVLTAEPSDEEPLQRAKIDRASAVVVATNHDAEDALAILTARELRPDVRIVAAATNRENVAKLERAGADAVVSPAQLGGHLLVRSAIGGDASGLVDQILREETT